MKVTCGEIFCKYNSGTEGKAPHLRCEKKKIRLFSASITKPTKYLYCQHYEFKY